MASYDQSIADVLKSTLKDAQDLVRSEMALARAELRGEVKRASVGIAALAGAAVAAVIALVFLLTTLAWGLYAGFGWPIWVGFAIVTLLMALAAAGLALLGRSRLAADRPMRMTMDSLKENMQWMRARTS
jgi:hypothetical protein